MFTIDPHIADLDMKKKDIVKVYFSINDHQVATPEMRLEEAHSYIMFFREDKGKLSSYIGLHLLLTDRKLFYAHSSNPFPEAEMASVEEEALCFVEGLGAMLDEVDFKKMSSWDRNLWLDEQEIFTSRQIPERTSEDQHGEAPPQEASTEHQAPQPQQGSPEAPSVPDAPQPPHMQQEPPAPSLVTETSPPAHQSPQPQESPVQYMPQAPQPQQVPPATPSPEQEMPQVQPVLPAPSVPDAPQMPYVQPAPSAPPPVTEESPPAQQSPQPQEAPVQYMTQTPQPQQGPPAGPSPVPQKPLQKVTAEPDEARSAREAGHRAATPDAPKRKQDIMQKAIRAGIVKPPKPSIQKEVRAAAGVVSRDREALARLFTSF